jgi:hypothetical protein
LWDALWSEEGYELAEEEPLEKSGNGMLFCLAGCDTVSTYTCLSVKKPSQHENAASVHNAMVQQSHRPSIPFTHTDHATGA